MTMEQPSCPVGPYSTAGTIYIDSLPGVGCYTLNVNDSYGDGICCAYGNGSYTVNVDGEDVLTGGQFTNDHQRRFLCGVERRAWMHLARRMQLQSPGHGGQRLLHLPLQRSLRR